MWLLRRELSLKREAIALSPLYYTLITPTPTDRVGYIRLTQFSQNAPLEMRRAISELEAQGANGYILDLRNNPGGLVNASIDIAGMWGQGRQAVFNVAGRGGEQLQQVRAGTRMQGCGGGEGSAFVAFPGFASYSYLGDSSGRSGCAGLVAGVAVLNSLDGSRLCAPCGTLPGRLCARQLTQHCISTPITIQAELKLLIHLCKRFADFMFKLS